MFPGPKFVISISVRHSLLLAHLHGLDGLEVLVQLIVEGDPSWQVDAHDLLVRHAFKVLDNAEKGVARLLPWAAIRIILPALI